MRYVDQADTLPSDRQRGNKLDQTTNILDLYMHCIGKSEVPMPWHLWSCLSLIAAAVGNRVFYRKFPWERIHPNMYIFLVGGSGAGKGQAIGFAMQLRHEMMNLWYGDATHKGLKDKFGETPRVGEEHLPPSEVVYLVQTELADSVGTGPMADGFVKSMTNWYNPTTVNFQERTRMHGEKQHPPPCINWLAGTTPEWLGECVSESSMMSGFFGRVVGVKGEYDWNNRVHDPMAFQPPDYDDIMFYLCSRIDALTKIPPDSEFAISDKAYAIDEDWYMGRPAPSEALIPFFRREHDLCLKIAMLLSLCRSQTLRIEDKDILQAQDMVKIARQDMPFIVEEASSNRFGKARTVVLRYIQETNGWRSKTELLRKVDKRRMKAAELNEILDELLALGFIETRQRGKKHEYRARAFGTIDLSIVASKSISERVEDYPNPFARAD